MKSWLTKAEVAELTGWSNRWIEFKVRTGLVRTRPSEEKSANGKPQREYDASSLPAEAQLRIASLKIASAHPAETALLHQPKQSVAQASLFAAVPEVSSEQLLLVDDADKQQAYERLNVIAPLIEYRQKKSPRVLVAGQIIDSLDALVKWLAAQHNIAARTIYRWDAIYRARGFAGLADRQRSDRGKSKFFSEFPKAAEYVEKKYLIERLSVALIAESLQRDWPEIYNHGSSAPSYTTIRSYLKTLPTSLRTLGREGETEYKNKCAPYVLRDYRTAKANQIWVSDHMQHDVFVRNDFLPGAHLQAAFRPYLTAIMDIRSRKVVGAAWCVNPSSQSIASAVRIAVMRFGLPETFYMDNGKDYRKVGKQDELCEAASGLLTRLGVKSIHAIPRHPQSKPIERWFGTLHARFDRAFHPSYCGPSPDLRPEECDASLKQHKEWLGQKRQRSPLVTASDFFRMAIAWIERDYNAEMPHSGQGMNGRSPDEVFHEELSSPVRPINVRELEPLFWDRQKRTLMEGGCVQLFSQRYEPADGPSAAALNLHHQREVLVACDPLNVGHALAFDLDGKFLGLLHSSKLLAWGPQSQEGIRAAKRYEKTIRRSLKDRLEGLGSLDGAAGMREQDRLRRNAGLPTIITAETAEELPLRIAAAAGSAASAARHQSVAPAYAEDIAEEFLRGEKGDA